MPKTSAFLFVIYFAFGCGFMPLLAQEIQSGINLSKHTIGYGMSYTYPKVADGSRNTSVKSDFNYGASVAFEWGKYYDSGISFMLTPMVYYSKYNNSILSQGLYHFKDDKLLYRTDYTIQFQEWTINFPISWEFPLFKNIRLGVGASVAVPLTSSGSIHRQEFDYYIKVGSQDGFYIDPILREEYTYDIDYRLEPEFGVTGKLLYQIHATERVESYLSMEYWYNITEGDPGYAHKTRFVLTYIHRYIQLKEVREKWDRYWIRKNKRNG